MRTQVIVLISALFAAGSVFAQAYRWVDQDGIVHYSDRPEPGAEEIQLPRDEQVTRRPRPAPAATQRPAGDQAETASASGYTSLEIASPAAEETLWNIEGVLNVALNLQPALQEDHQVRVYFDGEPRMVEGTSFQIPEVYRGVHNLQAEVVDGTGKLMIRSVPNRFYVQQNSVVNPRRPVRPRPQ